MASRHNIQVSDTFDLGKLYFELDSYLHNFRGSVMFPYISLYTQTIPYTTYAESTARRALNCNKELFQKEVVFRFEIAEG